MNHVLIPLPRWMHRVARGSLRARLGLGSGLLAARLHVTSVLALLGIGCLGQTDGASG